MDYKQIVSGINILLTPGYNGYILNHKPVSTGPTSPYLRVKLKYCPRNVPRMPAAKTQAILDSELTTTF